MQYTPSQLKERLLAGIDSEHNVVNMPRVLEVIKLLERYPITKEILEETRIGRLVNDVRRKTSDKQLAKRAKELVRNWQRVLSGGGVETPPVVNGDGLKHCPATPGARQGVNKPPISPALSSKGKSQSSASVYRLVSSPKLSVESSLSSRGQFHSKPGTPSLPTANNRQLAQSSHATKRSISSPQLVDTNLKRPCISPCVVKSKPGTPDSVGSGISVGSSSHVISDKCQIIPSSSASNSKNDLKRTQSVQNYAATVSPNGSDLRAVHSASSLVSKDKSGKNGMVVSPVHYNGGEVSTPTHSIETKGLKTTIRFNKTSPPVPPTPVNGVLETPKKRGRGRPPKNPKPTPPEDSNGTPQNGSVSKTLAEKRKIKLESLRIDIDSNSLDKFVNRTPKVKSTAELIQDLQAKNSLSVSRDTARQIQYNLINKEVDDDIVTSVVPDGAKPRPHKKRNMPPCTPVSLQTKTEMVEKFLQTSVTQSTPEDLSPIKYELSRTESPGNNSTSFEDSVETHNDSHGRSNLVEEIPGSTDQIDSKCVISTLKLESGSLKRTDSPERPVAGPSQESDKQLSLDEIYSKYLPLDVDNFVLDEDEYEMDEPCEVTDSDVVRLHSQHWPGVNGCYDGFGEWQDWSQTMSLPSYNSEFLHILPYVVTDD